MDLFYFAWLREKVGTGSEQRALPADITTVAALVEWLKTQSPGHAAAFADPALVRVAVIQDHAGLDAIVTDRDEVAFFPPVTGG